MNPCDRWILPRLVDGTMRLHVMLPYRLRMAAIARGGVADIGVGTGANLSHYGGSVGRLCGIDPSSAMLELAAARRGLSP